MHPEVSFHFFYDRKQASYLIEGDHVVNHILKPKARHPILWYYWFEKAVHKKLIEIKADLLISLDGFASLSSKVKQIVMLHDINFHHNSKWLSFWHAQYYNYFFVKYARKAHTLLTVSEFCKQDIHQHYRIAKDKIQVVYNGAPQKANTHPPKEKTSYFYYIGSLNPRKNIMGQLKAFDLYKTQTNSADKFLLAGEKRWFSKQDQAAIKQLKHYKDIEFLGRLSDEQHMGYLSSAKALMYVSHFEGFGLPILEAFSVQTPVITAINSALPEIAKDAALFADSNKVETIALCMQQIDVKADDLVAGGTKRLEDFSWQKSAEKLSKIMTDAFT